MDIADMLNGLLAAILQAKPDWQLTPEEQSAILNAAAQQIAAEDQTMSAAPPTPQAQVAFSNKAVGVIFDMLKAHFAGIEQETARVKGIYANAVDGLLSQQPPTTPAPAYTGGQKAASQTDPGTPRLTEMRSTYAHMSAEDMSYYLLMRNSIRRKNGQTAWTPESSFMRELADKAGKSYEAGNLHFEDAAATSSALKAINFLKANELSHSTQASYGDEWVPDLWASQLWEKVRLDNVVAPLFNVIEMPSNPFEYPLEGADPTVSLVSETTGIAEMNLNTTTTAIPSSKVGSSKVTLSAKKLALRVGFSSELVEDSIIGIVAQYRKQSMRAMQDAIDNVLLNGDIAVGASANINLIDGTPTATDKYLAFNGLRKLWAVTNTANGVDGGGLSVTLQNIRDARFKLDRAYNTKLDQLAIITHSEAYAKMLSLSEFITMDKAGNLATAMTGQIGFVDGMPVLVSNEYALTNSAGKIPAAGGTLGSFTVVYKSGWFMGYRRKVNVTMDFLPYYDTYQLTATVRLAFINRDTDVSAGVYNSLV
jgi:HK97 family phage major capsid protein